MGERQGDGSGHGRRRVHPGDAVPGSEEWAGGPRLESLLVGAMRSGALDTEAEQRAVAAFREARDAGAHRARTRRRDDWRPSGQRRTRRSLKATLALILGGLTLSGAAYAAIGTAGSSHAHHDDRRQGLPSATTDAPAGTPADGSTAPGAAGASHHPETAKDIDAHCRAYESVGGNGKALSSTAWQRLIAEAGGERNVAAYCAQRLGPDTGKSEKTKTPKNTAATDSANSGDTGNSANSGGTGTSGGSGNSGSTGNTAADGNAAKNN
ncbi:hypothetical protein ACFV29_00850 [Streptomyces sp. NPDC059690]|uniref:hypothetical protein n=1 Tax=Streptomyces sp. NPDC059690 TaxID=3346907 RepID=UPI003677E584